MFSPSHNILPSLTSRPPTPPHDTDEDVEDAITFLTGDFELDKVPQPASQTISSDTPPSSSPFRQSQNVNIAKRVEFISTPIYHPPPSIALGTSPKSSPVRSKLLRPAKSILKLGNISPLPTPEDGDSHSCYFTTNLPESFAKMLESTLKQLESSSKYSRLDAYIAINGALMTYEDVPDHREVINHMNSFQRFIIRDTTLRDLEESTNVNITVQALKLAARFLASDDFLRATESDFQATMLDRSISTLEQSNLPKQVVKMVLGLLAQQGFSNTVLTSSRADRLIAALQNIETRCQGNSVLATRIMIYRRLMDQGKSIMASRMRGWLQHLLNGMISDVPDIRNRAIEVTNNVGIIYGGNLFATKALHELLELEAEEGSPAFFEHFTLRIAEFIKDDEVASIVPQIWSALVLFHQNPKLPIHTWRRFKSWLTISQTGLTARNFELRRQTHSAWRILVHVVRPDAKTPPYVINLLMKPMRAGFQRGGADKRARDARRLALEGYYNLLHYACRPGMQLEDLDSAWTTFVTDIVKMMAESSSRGRHIAAKILRGLFTAKPGTWNPNAALDNAAILPEDLPRLDVKWIRSRLDKILPLVELILAPMLHAPVSETQQLGQDLWSSLIRSVVEAGAQEVTLTTERKTAIVNILNAFKRMTTKLGPLDGIFTKSFTQLQTYTLTQLGPRHFAEDFILHESIGTEAKLLRTLNSPSAAKGKYISPTAFVLSYTSPPTVPSAAAALRLVCSTKLEAVTRIQFLLRTWQVLAEAPCSGKIANAWTSIVTVLTEELADTAITRARDTVIPQQALAVGKTLLTAGATLPDADEIPSEVTQLLTKILIDLARDVAGEAGPAIAMIEPMSKSFMAQQGKLSLSASFDFVTATLTHASWPHHPQAEERAIKALIGVSGVHRSSTILFEHFLSLVLQVTESWYDHFPAQLENIKPMEYFRLLSDFGQHSPARVQRTVILRTLPALDSWLQDEQRQLFGGYTGNDRTSLPTMWSVMIVQLAETKLHDADFAVIDSSFVACFYSTSLDVVNSAVELWNRTFESYEMMQHSDKLQRALRSLDPIAIIKMPALTIPEYEALITLPAFEKSNISPAKQVSELPGTPKLRSFAQKAAFSKRAESVDRVRTPKSSTKRLFKSPRLRHDDSQIDFVPISELPALQAQDSQPFTDNQREVRDRQHADVQMYPELSSSPLPALFDKAQPAQAQLDVIKLVDTSDAAEPGTPTLADVEMTDGHTAPSPTPRITRRSAENMVRSALQATIVPSSVAEDAGVALQVPEQETLEHGHDNGEEGYAAQTDAEISHEVDMTVVDEIPSSDADLPNVQLQLEAELAASFHESPSQGRDSTTLTEINDDVRSSHGSAMTDKKSDRASRKRKRGKPSSTEKNAKQKTDHSSQRLSISYDDDEDVEDCIVVATSQHWTQSQESKVDATPELSAPVTVTPQRSSAVAATPVKDHASGSQTDKSSKDSRSKRRRLRKQNRISQEISPSSNAKRATRSSGTDMLHSSLDVPTRSTRTSSGNAKKPAASSTGDTSIVEQTDIDASTETRDDEAAPEQDEIEEEPVTVPSIISRLKEALHGIKSHVFGKKEEREIDDILFELRQANHEAGRRGRDAV